MELPSLTKQFWRSGLKFPNMYVGDYSLKTTLGWIFVHDNCISIIFEKPLQLFLVLYQFILQSRTQVRGCHRTTGDWCSRKSCFGFRSVYWRIYGLLASVWCIICLWCWCRVRTGGTSKTNSCGRCCFDFIFLFFSINYTKWSE